MLSARFYFLKCDQSNLLPVPPPSPQIYYVTFSGPPPPQVGALRSFWFLPMFLFLILS